MTVTINTVDKNAWRLEGQTETDFDNMIGCFVKGLYFHVNTQTTKVHFNPRNVVSITSSKD